MPNGKYQSENFTLPDDFSGYIQLKKVLTTNLVVKDISYDWLKSNLKELIQEFEDCIVDLTGVVKRIGFDIFIACSYLGVDKVTTFELKDTKKKGVYALYHNLNPPIDCEYVFLQSSQEFIDSLDAISTRKNKTKLLIVLSSIILASFVTIVNQFHKETSAKDYWIYLIVTQIFSIFGGILPLFDAWGGIRLKKIGKKP